MENGFDLSGVDDAEAFAVLSGSSVSMILTNPALQGNPIVYVNPSFERVTGYPPDEALGRNCRFLQGPDTDPEDVTRIRHAVASRTETTVDILNYRKDGARFVNRLLLSPVYGRDGALRYFMGIQKALTEDETRHSVNVNRHALREMKHRVKNHLSMITGMVRLQARDPNAGQESMRMLARRLESLQLLYEQLSGYSADRRPGQVELGAYVAKLTESTVALDERPGIRARLDITDTGCDSEVGAKIGLILSEILNNALQHAFVGRDSGCLTVSLRPVPDTGRVAIVVADDGRGIPAGENWPDIDSIGGRIVLGLLTEINATLDVDTGSTGTSVTLTVPTRN